MEQNLELLRQPFPPEMIEQKDGFDYIPHAFITARLNEALGVGGWSYTVISTQWIAAEDTIVCHGRITALIAGEHVMREHWGGQRINRKRRNPDGSPGDIVDISNDYKGAATDALKKCATLLGVGEQLYLPDPPKDRPQEAQQPPAGGRRMASPAQVNKILMERGRHQGGWDVVQAMLRAKESLPNLQGVDKQKAREMVEQALHLLTTAEASALIENLLALPAVLAGPRSGGDSSEQG